MVRLEQMGGDKVVVLTEWNEALFDTGWSFVSHSPVLPPSLSRRLPAIERDLQYKWKGCSHYHQFLMARYMTPVVLGNRPTIVSPCMSDAVLAVCVGAMPNPNLPAFLGGSTSSHNMLRLYSMAWRLSAIKLKGVYQPR